MQKWSQSITEQWKNYKKLMEKEREWKDKIKGTDWSSGAGCTMGRRLEGRAWSEGCRWLLMSGGRCVAGGAHG